MQPSLPPFEFDILAFIGAVGALQAFVVGIALLNRREGRTLSHRILGVLLLVFGTVSAGSLAFYTRFVFEAPHLARLHSPLNFLAPPLFYWYIRSLVEPKFKITTIRLLHFLPFVMWLGYFVPFFLLSEEEKVGILLEWFAQPTADRQFFGLTIIVQFLLYLIASYLLITQQRRPKETQPFGFPATRFSWIRNILVLVAAICFLNLWRYLFDWSFDTSFMTPILLTFTVTYIGYKGLQQPTTIAEPNRPSSPKKYAHSGLTAEESEKLSERLEQFMGEAKPYRDGSLTLASLAAQLNATPHDLSRILNEQLKTNFYNYLNRYRIEEAKRLLADPSYAHFSIAGIAQEVGCNSKSVFNTAFKELTGSTPSEYRLEHSPTSSNR